MTPQFTPDTSLAQQTERENPKLNQVSETTLIQCSQIIADNDGEVVTQWALEKTDGTRIYASGHYARFERFTLDLSILNLKVGTQFKLKACVTAGSDSKSSELLEYQPSTNTVFYDLTGTAFNTTLTLLTVVPIIFECSSLYGYNYSWTITKWTLYTLDGTQVYQSSNYSLVEDNWSLDLANITDLEPGTQLQLKAVVESGDDSLAPVTLQFNPDINVTGYFELVGNAFATSLVFYGSTNPNLI